MLISLIGTFHKEGKVSLNSLKSMRRSMDFSLKKGIPVEAICILDNADKETLEIVKEFCRGNKNFSFHRVNNRDLGKSRNDGVSIAIGEYVGVVDGDDYITENWLYFACEFMKSDKRKKMILHPEFIVNFGKEDNFIQQIDQESNLFDVKDIFYKNLWTSVSFAEKNVYVDTPYANMTTTGYGFEDWHWHCETIKKGYVHKVVKDTALYYRRKDSGILSTQKMEKRLIPPTELFM